MRRFKFQRFYRADEGMTVGVMNQMVMVNRIFGLYLFRLAGLFDFSIMLVMVRMGTRMLQHRSMCLLKT